MVVGRVCQRSKFHVSKKPSTCLLFESESAISIYRACISGVTKPSKMIIENNKRDLQY